MALTAAVSGCAHGQRAVAQASEPSVPTASPGIRSQAHGLELWVWVVSDPRPTPPEPEPKTSPEEPPADAAAERPGEQAAAKDKPAKPPKPEPIHYVIKDERVTLESVLRPYLDRPVPVPQEVREHWRVYGFRMVAVPPAALPKMEGAIRMVGAVQRQWLGEIPEWTDLIRGPQTDGGPVCGEDSVMQLDAGRLRLLGRCWSMPGAAEGSAALRLEMVAQHQPRLSDAQRFAAALEPPKPIEAQGFNFTHLSVGVTITGDDALVIVPDSPDANWNEDPSPDAPPATLNVPTIGERMLATPPTGTTPRMRAVVILLPHPREHFGLLP
jgi:hypothetical protein